MTKTEIIREAIDQAHGNIANVIDYVYEKAYAKGLADKEKDCSESYADE